MKCIIPVLLLAVADQAHAAPFCKLNPFSDDCCKCKNACTRTNCEQYFCCETGACLPERNCPDPSTCDFCKNYDGFCMKCDPLAQNGCCPDFAGTMVPTPSPVKKVGVPCICSPRIYTLIVNNYAGSPVDIRNLCSRDNNPLRVPGMPGIKPDTNEMCTLCTGEKFSLGCDVSPPSDVISIGWNEIDVKECSQVDRKFNIPDTCGKDLYTGAGNVGSPLQLESKISANLDGSECAEDQQKAPRGAGVTLTGVYTSSNSEQGTIEIDLQWQYSNNCAPVPFQTTAKFWESFFGTPLVEIGAFEGPNPAFCNADGCPSGAAVTSVATPELEDPAPESVGASSGTSCEDIVDKKPCMQADCLWDNAEKLCSDSTDTEGPLLAKSAVEESQALDEKPEPSAASAVASAWGVVTGLAMWFIMG